MPCTNTISEILKLKGSHAWSISPESTVFEAIKMMAEKDVGALLVTEGNKLLGLVTERDYTRKIALKGRSSKEVKVRGILSERLVAVSPAHKVEDCMRLMTENRVRHLPVLEAGIIQGLVSIGDLVNSIISEQDTTIHQLQTYISGHPA
jgi:CBS domain-containing protein